MKTLLLIEDDHSIAMVVGEALSDEGYRVVTATDGRQGLKCLREVKPDLVLSNVNLPLVSGAEVAKAVQTDPAIPTVPVVLMSAAWEPGATGFFNDYLRKPFTLDGLMQVVLNHIGPATDESPRH